MAKSRRLRLASGYYALVDSDDYEDVKKYKWHRVKGRHTNYAKRNGMMINGVPGKKVFLHRQIMNLKPFDGLEVDHKNRNGMDCRKGNMVATTRSKNLLNSKTHSRSKTKVKGVSWNKHAGKYVAQMSINGRQTYLGYFRTIRQARKIVEQARSVALNQDGSWQS